MGVQGFSGKGVPYYFDPALSPTIGTSLWEDCPIAAIRSNPSIGVVYDTQFMEFTPTANAINGWTTTVATSGTVTLDANLGLKVDSGATTANQGINMTLKSARFKVQANKPVWMESRVKFAGLSTTPRIQFLLGLADIQTALIAAGAVGTHDKIAFTSVSTTGVISSNATASATAGAGAGVTVANNDVVKFGLKATTASVQFFVNDALVSTLTANIPTGFLAPAIVMQSGGTVQPVLSVERFTAVGLF